jgi:hypothetical protein
MLELLDTQSRWNLLPRLALGHFDLQSYLGCQWKELPIGKDQHGRPEIHYTRIYRAFRRWEADGCFDAIFESSVSRLHCDARLDTSIIHGDGTTSAAKKGGDNLGFSGHKKVKGCKVVALCDRNCNVIAPFVSAPRNRNESPLLRQALPRLTRIARAVGLDLRGTVVSLDGVYDCRRNRKAIFNRGMVPNINANSRGRKAQKRGRKALFDAAIFKERFRTIESCSPGKTSSVACCYVSSESVSCTMR